MMTRSLDRRKDIGEGPTAVEMKQEVLDLTEAAVDTPPAHGTPAPIARKRTSSAGIALVLVDAALILVGFTIAYVMRYNVSWPAPINLIVREVLTVNYIPYTLFVPYALLLLLVLMVQFAMKGLYRAPRNAGLLDYAGTIASSTTTGIAFVVLLTVIQRPLYSRLIYAFAWGMIILLLCASRGLLIGLRRWRWARGIGCERVLVVGGTGLGRQVMEGIVAQPYLGYALVGYVEDNDPPPGERPNGHFRHLGRIAELAALIGDGAVDQVILALPFWQHYKLPELVQLCREAGVEFRVAPDLYELSFDRVDVGDLSGIPLIGLKELSLRGWNLVVKRAMDLTLTLLAAPVVLPLAALIVVAIRRDSPGPAIFEQRRLSKDGRPFTAYKFRTMVVDAEARKAALAPLNEADGPLFKIRNDPRMTRVGRILRRMSLDELPQLWNVLRGEMSLVGPRPPTLEEAACYQEWQARRLEVLPGLTGLWQVLGRSDTSFDEMVRLDIYYAENWSLGMDLRILLRTIPAVISGRGAY
jgi:exopolysaccharide biosynthesis polyprenyl glycosylphosphotransferase